MRRITAREWAAINAALARVLADEPDDTTDVDAMATAQAKVWERIDGPTVEQSRSMRAWGIDPV